MLIKASQRGGGQALARHLMNGEENEHVEVYEVSGFLSENVNSAFREAHAISKGTQCKQYLFSASFSPPENESVPYDVFEDAIARTEKKLGLEGQPRAIVFHEKKGRRHAHCVWSRIDTEKMKAVNLDYYKNKLNHLAKDIYLENGWELPQGFIDKRFRDPTTYNLAEWQQAKRMNLDPKEVKAMLKDCWAVSDSRDAFIAVLKERGYFLARGDRRGFVAVNYKGEALSLSKWTGVKSKELKARLGDPKQLRSLQSVRDEIGKRMTPNLRRYEREIIEQHKEAMLPLQAEQKAMKRKHQQNRKELLDRQKAQHQQEQRARSQRLAKGFRGIWDRLTGKYQKIRHQNEMEAAHCLEKRKEERQALYDRQLEQRRELQKRLKAKSEEHARELVQMQKDIAEYIDMRQDIPDLDRSFNKQNERKPELSQDFNREGGEIER